MKKRPSPITVSAIVALVVVLAPIPAAATSGSPEVSTLPSWFQVPAAPVSGSFSWDIHDSVAQEQTPSAWERFNGGEIVLHAQDDGRRVEMKDGQTLVVSLPANPSTGYVWEIEKRPLHAIRQVGQTTLKSGADLPGAAGQQVMQFVATETGETSLPLVYRRPWDLDGRPLQRFSVEVRGLGSFVDGPKRLAESSTATPDESDWEVAADSDGVASRQSLPASYDWCNQGGCTPVRDQGSCGSCWAFATNGVMESVIKIEDGVGRDLSEQYLVSCNTDNYGCGGGWWAFDYYEYLVPPGEPDYGAVNESDFPYVASDVSCGGPHAHHEKISSWQYVTWWGDIPSVSSIKQTMIDHGPVAVGVCVNAAFNYYNGDVLTTQDGQNCDTVNHGVVLVGWDDSKGSAGAWRLKNSWSSWWGDQGYMWIEYGASQVGAGAAYVNYQGTTNNPPHTPSSPSPPDGTTGVSIGTDLSWSGGDPDGDSVTYDVYFEASDSSPDQLICNDVSTAACDPGTLSYDMPYYWRVVATDANGASTESSTWDFWTEPAPNNPPDAPSAPSPSDGATGVSVGTDLSWTGGDPDGDTVTYDVYLTAGDSTQLICDDVSVAWCDPGTLAYGTHHDWQVTATDSHGAETIGPLWGFATTEQAVAGFSASPREGVVPLSVAFTNESMGSYDTCTWDFGDGATASGCSGVSHTYSAAGSYDVTLTVSGPGGTDALTRSSYVSVYEPPTAAFVADPVEGSAPLQVAFTDQSSGDYDTCQWDYGDGTTEAGCAGIAHSYSMPGTYDVTLTVSGPGGTDTLLRSAYISVHDPPVVAFAGDPLEGPAPLEVDFTNQTTGAYNTCEWAFGDGATAMGCSAVQHTYESAGTYTVTLAVSGTGGSDVRSEAAYITAYEPPEATFAGDPVDGPAPLHVTFSNLSTGDYDVCEWDFGDGTLVSDCGSVGHTYAAAGSYTVTLTVSGPGGTASRVQEAYITVDRPVEPVSSVALHQTPVGDIFVGNTVRFEADARGTVPFSYSWTLNGAPVGEDSNHLELALVEAGSYTLTVTVANPTGQETAEVVFSVREPDPAGQPDLSSSFQIVDPSTVRGGEVLTYTTVLRNNSPVDAEAVFVDPVPANTEYVEGSARASDAGEVTYHDGELRWSGRIVAGAPVIIQYRVAVQALGDLQVGTISNTGRLDDGLGNQMLLEAEVSYEPTAGISLDNGALYTNMPTVTLAFRNAEILSQVQLCTDRRFTGEGGWNLTSATETWQLNPDADRGTPTSVYAVFQSDSGEQVGPVHDVIIYDPVPPEITDVDVPMRVASEGSTGGVGGDSLRVTVSDDNSGVVSVQASWASDFADFVETEVVTNAITVSLPDGGGSAAPVFLRAVDRAGNCSEVWREAPYQLYLPLLVRFSH